MRLTPDTVRETARLARIRIEEEEIGRLAFELGRILEYMGRLIETDLEDPESGAAGEGPGPTRPDEPVPSVDREEVLRQAPDREGPFFRVPPVLPPREGGGEDEA